MTEEDFDNVVRVHLKGHFAPMKFASIYWRERSKAVGGAVYARVISTASESFLFGTPGQPNYAAAKAGIVSLTMGTAKVLLKYGGTANVVMPRARTRMTLQGPFGQMFAAPAEGFDNMNPANSSPLFAYLASPAAANITAQLFIVWGRQVVVMARPAHGEVFDNDDGLDRRGPAPPPRPALREAAADRGRLPDARGVDRPTPLAQRAEARSHRAAKRAARLSLPSNGCHRTAGHVMSRMPFGERLETSQGAAWSRSLRSSRRSS